MATATITSENCDMAILRRLIHPEQGDMPLAAARYVLKIKFDQGDIDRMNELALKGNQGKMTSAEHTELTEYARVSHLIAALQLKARQSLQRLGRSV